MVSESQVLDALRVVTDPDLGRDIVSLGFVKDIRVSDGTVGFTIELTTPACPERDRMRTLAREAVAALPGVGGVELMNAHKLPKPTVEGTVPAEQYGIKIISMGFFLREDDAIIWRGPMLHKTVQHFLGNVLWGDLDYLIVDLPPGTGDVQLTLCQAIPLTGAAVVSTPQDVALKVAQKAIAMFTQLNTPVLGIIENMASYVCPHCGARDDVFGAGGARRAADRLGVPFLGEIPLATEIRTSSDAGRPIVLDPTSPFAQAYLGVAEKLAAQVSIRNMQRELTPLVQITF
ncbi:MAG: chromosome partitioning protein [Gemmatimonadetes bacterium]|nr:MAG: chromosome partitioning protein [Gemmatimonadota bacterium]